MRYYGEKPTKNKLLLVSKYIDLNIRFKNIISICWFNHNAYESTGETWTGKNTSIIAPITTRTHE